MKIFDTLLNLFVLIIFLSVIEDLPLMPGLHEDVDDALSFDTANGRIAEATASGAVEVVAVIDYYAITLPQLGWKLEPSHRYLREGEVLNIDVENRNEESAQVTVHFRLSPAGAK